MIAWDYDARVRGSLDRTAATLWWRLLIVAAVLVSAILLGTLGFVLVEGWTLFDAFYMALMTLTTVGYGELQPLSFHGRLFASFLMLVGVATVFVSFAILGDTLLRLELTDYFDQRRRTRMLQHIAGHYIVCGAGRVGRSVVLELHRAGAKVVLIVRQRPRALEVGRDARRPDVDGRRVEGRDAPTGAHRHGRRTRAGRDRQ